MRELELTGERYAKIWWAFVWRATAGNLMVFLIDDTIMRVGPAAYPAIEWFRIIVPIAITFVTLKWALRAGFKDFRVVLVERGAVEVTAEVKL